MNSIPVWVGDAADYVIPDELKETKFTKNGFPDRRYKESAKFNLWLDDIKRKEKELVAWYLKAKESGAIDD